MFNAYWHSHIMPSLHTFTNARGTHTYEEIREHDEGYVFWLEMIKRCHLLKFQNSNRQTNRLWIGEWSEQVAGFSGVEYIMIWRRNPNQLLSYGEVIRCIDWLTSCRFSATTVEGVWLSRNCVRMRDTQPNTWI